MKEVNKVCSKCGSDEVKVEAFAHWNVYTQEWDQTDIFPELAFCDGCKEDDIEIIDAPLE